MTAKNGNELNMVFKNEFKQANHQNYTNCNFGIADLVCAEERIRIALNPLLCLVINEFFFYKAWTLLFFWLVLYKCVCVPHVSFPPESAVRLPGSWLAHLWCNPQTYRMKKHVVFWGVERSLHSCNWDHPTALRHISDTPRAGLHENVLRCSAQPTRPGQSSASYSRGRWTWSGSALNWQWRAGLLKWTSYPPGCSFDIWSNFLCGFSCQK